ncbi:hypothetical protein [Pseudoruegeria sp. SK021]|uniref:hypothetical protein n=1 Tax=Pseudoruegeria sp. SK021 TaxID=1933035 RepID=UPI000A247283|nr:hypothetical protein [Pseudoruegeria sp. SK021]OSP55116.1 hypothetical protein BV911_08785 [Pseudoruegeria sp. SK021]
MLLSRAVCAAFALAAVVGLSACTTELDSATQASGLGNFRLDRVVVVSDDPTRGPLSRDIEDAALKAAVTDAVTARFGRFKGDETYSLGIKVQAFVLAYPGVPILLAPRSMLLLSVNVYNDVPVRLNPETLNLTVFEDAGGDTVMGSGYTQSAEQQLLEVADNAAIEIELWLRKNENWFGGARSRPERSGDAVAAPATATKTGS